MRRLASNDASRADDLSQETFWRAYRHIRSFEARGRFLSWLFRIAYQAFVTDERRRRGDSQVPLPDEVEDEADELARVTTQHTFDQLIAMLRPEERAAIVLHYRHGLTHPEIAETLGIAKGTVKSLIRRARHKLQQAHAPTQQEVD